MAPLVAIAVAATAYLISEAPDQSAAIVATVASLAIAAGVLGWIEDARGLGVKIRALTQLLLGVAAAICLTALTGTSPWIVPLFAVAIAGYINAANFMDGVNGISGLHGLTVGASFAAVGVISDTDWLIGSGLVLAAAFAGFLPFNIFGGKVFLGDVGSYLLGAGIAGIACAAVAAGLSPVAAVAPLAIYLADTSFTLARRVLKGEVWHEAHRAHVYQRLTDVGFSHVGSALIVTAATVACAGIGLATQDGPGHLQAGAVVCVFLICAAYLSLPKLLARRSKDEIAPGRVSVAPSAVPASSLVPSLTAARSSHARHWAVIGASGFVGSAIVTELRKRGIEVVAVPAPRVELEAAHASAEGVLAAAKSGGEHVGVLVAAMKGADVVVNAAGLATPDSAGGEALLGANALLPALIAYAAARGGTKRMVHLSSAAVQGRRRVLDESSETAPESPYALSKALGESALLALASGNEGALPEIIILRATSVQGPGRATTARLQRLAASPIASVAGTGAGPTVVSSVTSLAEFTAEVGAHSTRVPNIVLQPWEGLSAAEALELAGGKSPMRLPVWLCRAAVASGFAVSRVWPRLAGPVRRVELMWFGQQQRSEWAESQQVVVHQHVRATLSRGN
ncbi:MAG: NAD-dependent epimerase/dehydratase family protein [Salinibacterium sp.]|nr:NAD-dependent epimerase/dehydratase family protein [Salinibacterium sp.]MBF0673464.1 NAD-dependent epimerase/dehydratase family protein [Salinibacterium sp.]